MGQIFSIGRVYNELEALIPIQFLFLFVFLQNANCKFPRIMDKTSYNIFFSKEHYKTTYSDEDGGRGG